MINEKLKWNEKYKTLSLKPPSTLLKFIPNANNKKALDLAGGLGRNAYELVKKGYIVDLIDISDVAISKIDKSKINTFCLDLDTYIIPQNEYDVIIKIKYFNLEILKQIPKSLKTDGYFIFETIDKYPIEKNRFFEIFKSFDIIHFNEKPFQFVGVKRGCN